MSNELEHNNKAEELNEVAVKTETKGAEKAEIKQKLSEKMEIDGIMEKKLGNEQSEGNHNKRKKEKLAKTEKDEVKKTTEEEGQKKKITEEEGQKKTITEEEGRVKRTTYAEGQAETMKVDGTVEKNPENDQSKSNKMNGANREKEGQMKKNRQEKIPTEKEQKKSVATGVMETLVNSLTKDELKEVLESSAQNVPGLVLDLLNRIDRVASRDELKRTIYVNNLNQETSSDMLRKAFLQYGKIEEAKVIVGKESGKSTCFGFVQFCTKSSALSALRDPKKEINGRHAHCSPKQYKRKHSSAQNKPQCISSIESHKEVHGPGGFGNPSMLGRGEYANPTVFGPGVNPTFPCHLNSQAVLGDFQFPNQWGHSNLQYEYSGSQYSQIEHRKGCGCCSIYCKEGEVKKTTHGEGQAETMKADGTVEKNPENDQSKHNKMNGANTGKEGQMKKNRQEEILAEKEQKKSVATEVTEMLVTSLTIDELKEVLKSSAQNVLGLEPDLLNRIDCVASRDESKRTIYVNNLNRETSSQMLRKAFLQYGNIKEANVVVDKESGKSMGFGFVQFCTKSSALSALRDPKKEINGRHAHCAPKIKKRKRSSAQNNPQCISSIESYMEAHGPGEFVNPALHGPGGFGNPSMLGRGEYANRTVFGPGVNPTFPCHLNLKAVLGDFQFPNQWGRSNLQYKYSGSQYSQIEHEKGCGCGSVYCKEGEVKKTTHGEGQAETMKLDGTVGKNPENDQSKSNKMNIVNIEKEGQMKKNRQEEILTEKEQKKSVATEVTETLVNSLTKDELKEVLKSSAQNVPGLVPNLLNHIDRVASRDKLKRTLFVNNLNQETSSEMLRKAFLQYGKIKEAEVIVHKESGFGFVEFCTKSSALSALRDPKKEINGRQTRCSLKKNQHRSSLGESVNLAIHGPGGFVNPITLGRGVYGSPTVFRPRVNSTFPWHLNSQVVLGDFQIPNQWGHSNL